MTQQADRQAITDQVARYSYLADARDLDGFLALFTEDAVWQSFPPDQTEPAVKLESRNAIRDYSVELYKRHVRTGHHQSGLLITELKATTAKSQNMVLVTHQGPDDDTPRIALFGIYHDTWRKTEKGWLISSRTLRMGGAMPL